MKSQAFFIVTPFFTIAIHPFNGIAYIVHKINCTAIFFVFCGIVISFAVHREKIIPNQ
jgi:hypothetical protein